VTCGASGGVSLSGYILKKMFRESGKNREMRAVRVTLRKPLTSAILVACTPAGLKRNLLTLVLCQKLQKITQTVPEIRICG
jgi:hypothetical protein